MSFLSKLFGKNRAAGGGAGRHAAPRQGEQPAVEEVPAERPLFRDEVSGTGQETLAGTGPLGATGPIAAGAPAGAGAVACPRCRARADAASRFCSQCGAPLRGGVGAPEHSSETTSTISISGIEAYDSETTGQHVLPLPPEAQAAVEALPMGSALLVVRRGPNSGSRFLLDREVTTAGRHPESDIFLDDVTVSRRHVEFRRGPDGHFAVSDVGSLNGTYVNRERMESSVPLASGDEVQIGKYRLVFFASPRSV